MDTSLLMRCPSLGSPLTGVGEAPGLADLTAVLSSVELDDAEVAALAKADPAKPYGRQVLVDTKVLEGMVALWTRGVPCAPHDHGGSVGAVRVLQGEALHTVWRLAEGRLEKVRTHRVERGEVVRCGPNMIHSMVDGGAERPLVTLHLYADPIDHMVVYDLDAQRTCIVEGTCGAWVPHDAPEMLRAAVDGFVRAV